MSGRRDAVASALEHAADAAEEAARDQEQAAAIAREAASSRRADSPADSPDTTHVTTTVLHLLGGSAQRLVTAVGALRRTWAQALADESLTIRQIGERLGVSHQRVSALLARHRRDNADPQIG